VRFFYSWKLVMASWNDIEKMFNRAFKLSFVQQKIFLVTPFLVICSCIFTLCCGHSEEHLSWMRVHLLCLPLFMSLGLLLMVGLVVSRAYQQELEGLIFRVNDIIKDSMPLLQQLSYLAMSFLILYNVLWTLLGGYEIIRSIPLLGVLVETLFAYIPFLLLFSIGILGCLGILHLFCLPPLLVFRSNLRWRSLRLVWERIAFSPFTNALLLLIALAPFACMLSILLCAVQLSGHSTVQSYSLINHIKLFTIALPLSMLIAPLVIFFFHFSVESHLWLQTQIQEKKAKTTEPL
jgi:hypothetical protein